MRTFAAFALTFLAILIVPLWNGFPLVYADTGTYLLSAFEGLVPPDRPYWYGVFIRITSGGGHSLWGPVIAQGLLCAWLITRVFRACFPGANSRWNPAIAFLLAAGTGLSWCAGALMPDIFTALGILALWLLVTQSIAIRERSALAALVVVAGLVHQSNLLILSVVVLAFAGMVHWKKCRTALLSVACAWIAMPALNYAVDGEAYVSKGSQVFMLARASETGLLKDWLDAHCGERPMRLCACRDSLPTTSEAFLWNAESPLQRMGGWDSTRQEFKEVSHGLMTEPRFAARFALAGMRSTWQQLGQLHVGHRFNGTWYREPGSPPYAAIERTMPTELPAYRNARMQAADGGSPWLAWADGFYAALLPISAILATLLLFLPAMRPRDPLLRSLLVAMLLGILVNCVVCASLSMPDDRFLSRVGWLLPLAVSMGLVSFLRNRGAEPAPA